MKHCPSCQSQYSDDTLSFCLQDGTPLAAEATQSSIDTVAFSRPVTQQKISVTQEFTPEPAVTNSDLRPQMPLNSQVPPKKSNALKIAAIFAVPAVLMMAAMGIGGWVYFNGMKTARGNHESEVQIAPVPTPVPPSEPAAPPAPPAEADVQPESDMPVSDTLKNEIMQALDAWKKATESRNAAAVASLYAPKVEYLDNSVATVEFIKNDLQKTFAIYDEVLLELSDIKIAVDEGGTTATAVFDKEWDYESSDTLKDGKAHVRMRFQKIDGVWKIVSEKNLKVYFLQE